MNGDSSTTATTVAPVRVGRPGGRTVARRALMLWRRYPRRPPGGAPRTDLVAERAEPRPARAGG